MYKVQIRKPMARTEVIEFPRSDEFAEWEKEIESRLRKLTNLIEGYSDTTFNVLITEKTGVRRAMEELMVKESALEWVARVAKHSTGKVREGLCTDIDRALVDLEGTAESLIRAAEHWAYSDFGRSREQAGFQDCT
ncbi:MAG TPA: hypothetical protein VMJ93_13650 [Verrucomicrobiae bacterium]|nr:hypothetical protein [Verrucomicrobiae bacterium]